MGRLYQIVLSLLFLLLYTALPAAGQEQPPYRCPCRPEQTPETTTGVRHWPKLPAPPVRHHGTFTSGAVKGPVPGGMVGPAARQATGRPGEQPLSGQKGTPPAGEISILIDTTRRTLTVLANGEPYRQYPVAVGKHETPTPLGNYRVKRKAMHWGTGFGSRWLGLDVPWGLYGIHGTNKPWAIGSYASHGCIRMHNRDVEEMYPWIPVGAPVIIIGNPFTYREPPYRDLRRDFCGSDVMEVQRTLTRLGLFKGKIDGTWRQDMEESVYTLRARHGLSRDNVIDRPAYQALGL